MPSDHSRSPALDSLRLTPVAGNQRPPLDDTEAVLDAPPKTELRDATDKLLERLTDLQDAFHADGRHALLLVLQGRDASGKDGAIRRVTGAFNPSGVSIASFGPPTPLELRHDFLWRVHQVAPARGMIGVFNRSHYEDVLVARVRELVPKATWKHRYAQINDFERLLHESGTIIRKCMLHVSREEQGVRLRARLDDPTKNWKFRLGDLDDRRDWEAFSEAYRDALAECSTGWAPWYVVPADRKPLRDYLIAKLLVETLEGLDLAYPPIDPDVRRQAKDFA